MKREQRERVGTKGNTFYWSGCGEKGEGGGRGVTIDGEGRGYLTLTQGPSVLYQIQNNYSKIYTVTVSRQLGGQVEERRERRGAVRNPLQAAASTRGGW